jgi:Delta3-Delta2-enoyl-CoA isomerase
VSAVFPTLERDGEVALLDLGDSENRFTPESVAAIDSALDAALAAPGVAALVTRAHGKIFSNGLDLVWMEGGPGRREPLVRALQDLFARMLELPVPTVAAVQGHAFAGGAMLALVHDVTVMRAGRGFWCLPEVALDLPFTTGMTALLRAKLPTRVAHTAMTTGRRYSGTEAVAAGIVDATAADERAVLAAALSTARALAVGARPALGAIRSRLYVDAVQALRTDTLIRPESGTRRPGDHR